MRREIHWTQVVLEAVLVVLSVLLALGLNGWQQARADRRMADQALRNLEREIRGNRDAIADVLPVHRTLFDTLRSEDPPMGITSRTAAIENNAWEAAQALGALPWIEFDIVASASRIQETQRRYQSTVATVDGIMILGTFGAGGQSFSPERIPAGLLLVVAELLKLETELMDLYDEALERIGQKEGA